MQDQYEAVVNLFDELIHEAQGKMYEHINFRPEDIRLSAPEILIELLHQGLSMRCCLPQPRSIGKDFVYRGLTLLPTYEMAVSV